MQEKQLGSGPKAVHDLRNKLGERRYILLTKDGVENRICPDCQSVSTVNLDERGDLLWSLVTPGT